MCALIFSTTLVWNISHSMKNWARYDKKCALVFMLSTKYPCHIFMKLEFSWQILQNIQISNFVKICPVGASCSMWKDGQADIVTDHQEVWTPNHKLRPVDTLWKGCEGGCYSPSYVSNGSISTANENTNGRRTYSGNFYFVS